MIHSNNKCPDQPAHRQLAPLFLESVYENKNQKNRQSFKQFGSVKPDLAHCLQTETMPPPPPTHPLTEIPGIAHEQHTHIKSGAPDPLTIVLFVFNDPPTDKAI